MRLVTRNEVTKKALIDDLKREGIRFELHERLGYESFIGYSLEGTLEEIRAQIDVIEGADREALKEGFVSFRESLNHILEHLKVGEKVENLIREGPWVAEILDQLARNGAIEVSEGTARLKGEVDVSELRFQFKFPFNLVHSPESAERIARQYVLTDLVVEYEIEILELDMAKINAVGRVAAKYFPEDYLLRAYFGLVGRSILAAEILKAIGDEKVPEVEVIGAFTRAAPIEIPTEKGTLVVNYGRGTVEEVLRLLKKLGYVEIKGGKVRKIKDLV
ncbi:hypothetical protein E3E36_01750 [Thermococcus sp. M36]|uniref:hypothetical protein n=1 Tax=Thermococcus sp. M36 TaxID=1638261 RepID=UPI00143BEF95|nr:hypothetical protein [Thermococcus sp. M36]NJE04893.1 hypothetical protein [Thermococcus sp. M36]